VKLKDHDGQWLQLPPNTRYAIDFDVSMPKTFSMEFDLIRKKGKPQKNETGYFELNAVAPVQGTRLADLPPGKSGISVRFFQNGDVSLAKYEGKNTYGHASIEASKINWKAEGEENHIAVWVQGARVRVYVNETKVADIPELMNTDVPNNRIVFNSMLTVSEMSAVTRFK